MQCQWAWKDKSEQHLKKKKKKEKAESQGTSDVLLYVEFAALISHAL